MDNTHGGYREGSGRSKSGYYKGIYCGSTYELCWVIYHLDHNIEFSRFEKLLELNGIRYYPDFILNDNKTIIEVKGYEKQDSVDKKTQVAIYHGYNVIVLRKDDLKHIFEYVKNQYGKIDTIYRLFDNNKHYDLKICEECGKEFKLYHKRYIGRFCSKQCSCKYIQKQNKQMGKIFSDKTLRLEKSPRRKLSDVDALEIFNSPLSISVLSEKYNIHKSAIWFIKQKITYKNIHEMSIKSDCKLDDVT
jgi:hypothetical protein